MPAIPAVRTDEAAQKALAELQKSRAPPPPPAPRGPVLTPETARPATPAAAAAAAAARREAEGRGAGGQADDAAHRRLPLRAGARA